MACHYMDLPFWALKLRHPTTCEAEGPEVHPETCPLGLIVRYEFPERDGLPPVQLTWYDGNLIPQEVAGERVPGSGVMFVGSEGKMFADYGNYRLFPADKFANFKPPAQTIPSFDRPPRRMDQGLQGRLADDLQLRLLRRPDRGGAAGQRGLPRRPEARVGRPNTCKATNCPEADKYISKAYRAGWEVV